MYKVIVVLGVFILFFIVNFLVSFIIARIICKSNDPKEEFENTGYVGWISELFISSVLCVIIFLLVYGGNML